MSLHYLLDGYNITKQIPQLSRKKHKGERESLIHLIETVRPQGSIKNKVTVVWDGRAGMDALTDRSHKIVSSIFSKEISADDRIREFVRSFKHKKQLIVVTDDKELKFSIRALGARVSCVKDFLDKCSVSTEKKNKRKKRDPSDRKYISKSAEHEINEELKKIWIDSRD